MEFVTRFDLGQIVWRVGRQQHKSSDSCAACDGSGRLEVTRLDGTTQRSYCEACNGRGVIHEVWYDLWEVYDQSRIGQVTVKIRSLESRLYMGDPEVEEAYMVEATGVGSGTVYPLRDGVWSSTMLFGSEEEAIDYCATENIPIRAEVEETRARLRDEVTA